MRVLMLAGAGGVGKTTVLNRMGSLHLFQNVEIKTVALPNNPITERFPQVKDMHFETLPSITRDFYASKGLSTEAQSLAQTEQEQLDFQLAMFDFYLSKNEQVIEEARQRGVDVLITDRAPHDYIAWTVYKAQTLMTLELFEDMVGRANEFAADIEAELIFFPYPQKWSRNQPSDNFRQDYPGKNLLISAMLHNLIFDRADMDGVVCTYLLPTDIDARVLMIVGHAVEDPEGDGEIDLMDSRPLQNHDDESMEEEAADSLYQAAPLATKHPDTKI